MPHCPLEKTPEGTGEDILWGPQESWMETVQEIVWLPYTCTCITHTYTHLCKCSVLPYTWSPKVQRPSSLWTIEVWLLRISLCKFSRIWSGLKNHVFAPDSVNWPNSSEKPGNAIDNLIFLFYYTADTMVIQILFHVQWLGDLWKVTEPLFSSSVKYS